ncbi:transglycosylase SLT domain-containing protein [Halobacillus salinarum]|uniref:Transglycosylase SLT domain-containing protein n=1 Tax=Halobacillus salinarum TaxID=2932257 RepID=A0ABY4EDH3_9BACI|nr:transglycosylase SLT domain-containing protein [Halobacillus salinarum]UOQ42502.1 transglycosylase SLT domain-containing protein [Halobacillus salinarum]
MQSKALFVQISGTLLIVVCTFFAAYAYKQRQVEKLEGQVQQLTLQNKQLHAENEYLQKDSLSLSKKSSYKKWMQIEEKADSFVKESKGRFKKAWAMYLVKEANEYQIDPNLVFELLHVESGGTFNPNLVGPETKYGRAYGMSQFMKNTAPWIAKMGGLPYEKKLLFNPYYSMKLSLVYLDFLKEKYGNWNEALTAYNRGMNGLVQYKKKNGHARSSYATIIQNNAKAVAVAN